MQKRIGLRHICHEDHVSIRQQLTYQQFKKQRLFLFRLFQERISARTSKYE